MVSRVRVIAFIGLLLTIVWVGTAGVSAKRAAKYVGSEDCAVCHEDTHPEIIKSHANTLHSRAMFDAAKNPKSIVAVFGPDAPIKKADIKYVLGSGKVYQNYLDKNFRVLPAKWLVKEKKWVKQQAVDGLTQCVGCHVTNLDPESKKWTEMGVGCEACHGPGAAHADSQDPKDIVSLKNLDQKHLNMVCGQCHAVGTDLSGKYAYSPTFVPGDDLTKHFKLKDPAVGAANSQYNTFLGSKHEAGGQKCTSCHEAHGVNVKGPKQLRSPVNDLCLGCHTMKLGDTEAIKDLKSHAPDAAPDATCASCHMEGNSHAFKKASSK
ncbi:MAG: multiheme c-type cytochrome [Armatimonadota bacterium]|nr:multiheme c-type cytochrome [Armatimonadota bacterium]